MTSCRRRRANTIYFRSPPRKCHANSRSSKSTKAPMLLFFSLVGLFHHKPCSSYFYEKVERRAYGIVQQSKHGAAKPLIVTTRRKVGNRRSSSKPRAAVTICRLKNVVDWHTKKRANVRRFITRDNVKRKSPRYPPS